VGVKQHYSDALARKLASQDLLTPSEVAVIFRVDPKTVTRWAREGKLDPIRTLGGHRRYRTAEIRELLTVR
jgi:excisionase family DNA binding protein